MKFSSAIALAALTLFNTVRGDGTIVLQDKILQSTNIPQLCHGSASTRTRR